MMRAQEVVCEKAAVSSGHALASEAALAILKRGGNAVDAAVCAALVLCVVAPYACTLAGDAYLLIHDPREGQVLGLNGTGAAPQAATLDRFADTIPRSGAQAATVPGLVAALADALNRCGTMAFADLLEPAVTLARDGFGVFPYFRANIIDRQDMLRKDARMAALFLPGGEPLAQGAHFAQPQLAATLARLMDAGPDDFYRGAVARDLATASQAQGGLVTEGDLAAHASLWQEPVSAPFYGHDVWTMPPNSFGPTLLLQLLALERAGVHDLDPDGADFVTTGFDARRAAYQAAGRLIGDPALCETPLRALLADCVSGKIDQRTPAPTESKDRCTTTVAVIDKDGMAVSLIESISMPFGAGVLLGDTGIVLNNRLGGFSTDPASLNALAPGKRPAHTLAPCLVTKSGELAMTIGTPGTVGQTCTLAQLLARMLACAQPPLQAVEAARWSADFQGALIVEDMMAPDIVRQVRARMEARSEKTGWISFGSVKLAMREGGGCRAVADGRRAAFAAGY